MAEEKSTDSGEYVIFGAEDVIFDRLLFGVELDGLLFGVELDVVGNDPS